MRSRHVSTVIAAAPEAVYAFAADPENLPKWAAGLAGAEVERVGDQLVVESPMGRVIVEFAPLNPFGVLDHDVTLPTGVVVSNPVRVLAHPEGSEVVFTLRQLEMSDDELADDAAMVEADLARLKAIVEGSPAQPQTKGVDSPAGLVETGAADASACVLTNGHCLGMDGVWAACGPTTRSTPCAEHRHG